MHRSSPTQTAEPIGSIQGLIDALPRDVWIVQTNHYSADELFDIDQIRSPTHEPQSKIALHRGDGFKQELVDYSRPLLVQVDYDEIVISNTKNDMSLYHNEYIYRPQPIPIRNVPRRRCPSPCVPTDIVHWDKMANSYSGFCRLWRTMDIVSMVLSSSSNNLIIVRDMPCGLREFNKIVAHMIKLIKSTPTSVVFSTRFIPSNITCLTTHRKVNMVSFRSKFAKSLMHLYLNMRVFSNSEYKALPPLAEMWTIAHRDYPGTSEIGYIDFNLVPQIFTPPTPEPINPCLPEKVEVDLPLSSRPQPDGADELAEVKVDLPMSSRQPDTTDESIKMNEAPSDEFIYPWQDKDGIIIGRMKLDGPLRVYQRGSVDSMGNFVESGDWTSDPSMSRSIFSFFGF